MHSRRASSSKELGDVIKIGRRGSLHGKLKVHGVQGHVAYPQLASNPIHKAMLPLHELIKETWDEGNEDFPPTTLQVSNIHSGTGTDNVIPGTLDAQFNFRFSTALTEAQIRSRTEAILDAHELEYTLDWQLSGNPFLTSRGTLIDVVSQSIKHINGVETQCSTTGGTSDGRFIAPTGAQLLELGPCNATIHKMNENVKISELDELTRIYEEVLTRLLRNS